MQRVSELVEKGFWNAKGVRRGAKGEKGKGKKSEEVQKETLDKKIV